MPSDKSKRELCQLMFNKAMEHVKDASLTAAEHAAGEDSVSLVTLISSYAGASAAWTLATTRALAHYPEVRHVTESFDERVAADMTALLAVMAMAEPKELDSIREGIRSVIADANPLIKESLDAAYAEEDSR